MENPQNRKHSLLKTWRDRIPPPPPITHPPLAPKPPDQSQSKREAIDQILEDGFKQDVKNLKTGCLISYHLGCLILAALAFLIGLLTLFSVIFGK